jgi:hypothetical protein
LLTLLIGANFGYFTTYAATLGCRVKAVEVCVFTHIQEMCSQRSIPLGTTPVD